MLSWAEVLLILVTYCGGRYPILTSSPEAFDASKAFPDQCRVERYQCIKRAAASTPKAEAADLIHVCLSNPQAYPVTASSPSPQPSVSPSPQPSVSASPQPSVSISPSPNPLSNIPIVTPAQSPSEKK